MVDCNAVVASQHTTGLRVCFVRCGLFPLPSVVRASGSFGVGTRLPNFWINVSFINLKDCKVPGSHIRSFCFLPTIRKRVGLDDWLRQEFFMGQPSTTTNYGRKRPSSDDHGVKCRVWQPKRSKKKDSKTAGGTAR